MGYAALISAYELAVPLPTHLHAVSPRHRKAVTERWQIHPASRAIDNTLEAHLRFALKWEGVDLGVLDRLFVAVGPEPIAAWLRQRPTSAYARRCWFLYEWLVGQRLDIEDLRQGNYVTVLNTSQQLAVEGQLSRRHRVRNNLPGTPAFCPLVRWTPKLREMVKLDLTSRARELSAAFPPDVLARTAAFLLLADSRSSFAIEGETPLRSRVERWGRVVGEAGKNEVGIPELCRLQRIVIADGRFVPLGLRDAGGFVGSHDRSTGEPIPEHISARSRDLVSLLDGITAFDRRSTGSLDAIIAAACVAFGFVYIHPFFDGNGRLHRYLIHHILARNGFNPEGLVFPISSAIQRDLRSYRAVLRSHSAAILPLIHWEATPDNSVEVVEDSAHLYRFFDATPHAEFLCDRVRATIEEDLPREAAFLVAYDRFEEDVLRLLDMPGKTVHLLFRFLHQNTGQLSRRARLKEFAALTDREVDQIEQVYAETFEDPSPWS